MLTSGRRYCSQSAENRRKSVTDSGYAVILMSKVRTSASKKIDLMALIGTVAISTTTFERMKEKFYGFYGFYGFWQTVLSNVDSLTIMLT